MSARSQWNVGDRVLANRDGRCRYQLHGCPVVCAQLGVEAPAIVVQRRPDMASAKVPSLLLLAGSLERNY
jgi:hypothetical protein